MGTSFKSTLLYLRLLSIFKAHAVDKLSLLDSTSGLQIDRKSGNSNGDNERLF